MVSGRFNLKSNNGCKKNTRLIKGYERSSRGVFKEEHQYTSLSVRRS